MYCVNGKLLGINLTDQSTWVHELDDEIIKNYVGSRTLGAKLLLDLQKPGVEPLSPENLFLVLTGPVTGTITPNACKYVVVTKSPLTGAYLDSYSSGYIAPELKFAGWDGLIITGKADKPVYLWIQDDKVEFRDASHIWGRDTISSEKVIISETGSQAGVMVIGPAGENLSRVASINSDHYRQAARGGGGAVMGSKNLKAVAVLGSGEMVPSNAEGLLEKYLEDLAKLRKHPVGQARKKFGTPMTMNITNRAGMLPTRNFQQGTFSEATGNIDGEGVEKLTVKTRGCWGCMIGCSKITKVTEGVYEGDVLEGPEYETNALLGSNLGISYLPAVIRLNILCDTLGLDTISTGAIVSFVMECYEKGLLTEEQIGVKNPSFGNHEAAHKLIEMMASREGFGDVMAEGVKRAAAYVGKDSHKFAMHVKGMEFPAYDPRAGFGSCLSYSVVPRGACHRRAWPPAKEVLGGMPPFTTDGKAAMVKELFDENAILHTLLVCDFPSKFAGLLMDDYAAYLSLTTGHSFSADDLYVLAERSETLARLFNCREGFTRKDDILPGRIFEESLPDGPPKGQRFTHGDLDKMLDEYYSLRGWDQEGRPTQDTLQRLGLVE